MHNIKWYCYLFIISFFSPLTTVCKNHSKKKKSKKNYTVTLRDTLRQQLQNIKQQQIKMELYNKRPIAITNMKRTDGFGANVQQILGAAFFAEFNNYPFFYQPFKTMEHNYDGKPDDPGFLARREGLMDLIENMNVVNKTIEDTYQIRTADYSYFLDTHVDQYGQSPIIKKIKEIFRANKNRSNYFDDKFLNIAIHIRRPNPHDSRVYGTDVPNSIYVEILNKLREMYADQHPQFHIYSQGDMNNFIEFEAPDTMFHIDEPLEDTYTAMVLADVLVTGRSSLSYTAGYLSDGTVYYIPYMHKPLPHWIALENLLDKKIK